ncbi:hypothetical protein JCM19237_2298 [Photobacterium aphoticum]|uniref:Uncharacterized protein n=1 Tax=Photobacterium aphoticum TaxID=754436 RepID=A0A090R958_9GAMM|nr:hypothetical protein JCM19237_2298 [Photobacterium aphoticum]
MAKYRQSSGYDAEAYNKLAYQINLKQLGKQRLSRQQTQNASLQVNKVKDVKGAELLAGNTCARSNHKKRWPGLTSPLIGQEPQAVSRLKEKS